MRLLCKIISFFDKVPTLKTPCFSYVFKKFVEFFASGKKKRSRASRAGVFRPFAATNAAKKNSFKIITDLFRKRLAALFPSVRAMILLAYGFAKKTRF